MLVPVWLDEAVVGDGVDLVVNGPFDYLLRFYGSTDPADLPAGEAPVENLLIEGEELAVAGTIGAVIGTRSSPPLVVVRCGGLQIIASSASASGTLTFSGRFDVEAWGDEIDRDDDDLESTACRGVVRRLQLVEMRKRELFPRYFVPMGEAARYEITETRPHYRSRGGVPIYECELLAHVEFDVGDLPRTG